MTGIGAVVLVGGKSSRMGKNKALLCYDGSTFLERVIAQLRDFPELLLSVDREERYVHYGTTMVTDTRPGCGPIGGICAALKVCQSDFMLVVSCDLPHFTHEFAAFLCTCASPEYDAIVPVTRDGRTHPLCGLYHKRTIKSFEKQIDKGHYRMIDTLNLLHIKQIFLADSMYPDVLLRNINTPEEYEVLLRQE